MKNIVKSMTIVAMITTLSWSITAKEVMKKVYTKADRHKTQKFDVKMNIVNKAGEYKYRFFTNKKQIKKSERKGLIRFYKPTNIKNSSLLTISKKGNKNQWIYLPAFKSIKRLNTKERSKSFMGSDFSYIDIAGRELNDDKHKMLKQDSKYYYIQSKPKNKKDSYSKMELIVDKKKFIVLKIIFYDKKGKQLKTLDNKKFKLIKGSYFAVLSIMKNLKYGGNTKLEVNEIEVGKSVGYIGIKSLK